VMPMRAPSGRSRPMRVVWPTGTHRRRWPRKAFFSRARGISYRERITFTNSELSLK
jgi:hypothetical protein